VGPQGPQGEVGPQGPAGTGGGSEGPLATVRIVHQTCTPGGGSTLDTTDQGDDEPVHEFCVAACDPGEAGLIAWESESISGTSYVPRNITPSPVDAAADGSYATGFVGRVVAVWGGRTPAVNQQQEISTTVTMLCLPQ
jgi:hypothetical protein